MRRVYTLDFLILAVLYIAAETGSRTPIRISSGSLCTSQNCIRSAVIWKTLTSKRSEWIVVHERHIRKSLEETRVSDVPFRKRGKPSCAHM